METRSSMNPRHRFIFVLTLAIIVILMNSEALIAQQPTFRSPLRTFSSPVLSSRVISERTKWMFSHDVVDAAQSAIPLALESQRYGFAPSQNRISDFMIGRAVVGVLMLESNGGISPSVENWNADEIEFVRQEINQALQWWTQQSQAGNVRLEFVIPSNHPLTVPTRYEPIQMIGLEEPFGQADVWINDAMIYLGYNDPSKSYLDRVR